jgi:hypothetical protein
MSETILGKLEVKTSNGRGTAVVLNGDAIPQSGFVVGDPQGQLGGNPQPKEPSFITGQLDLKDEKGNVVMSFGLGPVNIGQSSGVIDLMGLEGESNLHLNGNGIISVSGAAQILLGEKPQGLLANAKPPIALNAIERTLVLTNAFGATVSLAAGNAGGEIRIPGGLHATNSTLRLGAGVDGDGGSGVFFL